MQAGVLLQTKVYSYIFARSKSYIETLMFQLYYIRFELSEGQYNYAQHNITASAI